MKANKGAFPEQGARPGLCEGARHGKVLRTVEVQCFPDPGWNWGSPGPAQELSLARMRGVTQL